MTERPDSTVIVVSYRPGDWLEPCLMSVREQAAELIVVDNASTGAQASIIARRCGAKALRTRHNVGFAGGVAVGLGEARGDVIGVLNDDAVAEPGWLDSAAAGLADPTVGAVTPKVLLEGRFAEVTVPDEAWFAPGDARPLGRQVRSLTVDGRDVLASAVGGGLHEVETGPGGADDRWRWTAGPRPFYVPLGPSGPDADILVDGETAVRGPVVPVVNHAGSFLRGHGIAGEYGLGVPDDGRLDRTADRFGFSGTAPVFRADTLRRLGAFAPQYFAYNEDTDWCLRAHLAGLRVVYDPAARVRHRLSATSGGTAALRVRRLSQRNALLCLVRNAPAAVAWPHVTERLARGWRDPVARQLAAKLPWAVSSRLALARHWVHDPSEVWEEWADRDTTWDDGPARVGDVPTATDA